MHSILTNTFRMPKVWERDAIIDALNVSYHKTAYIMKVGLMGHMT
jgi:hypothetical protein